MGLVAKWFQGKTVLAERDIDNAYWELPKEGVYDSIKQASQLVRTHRGMRGNFFFSIAKGGERSMDRIGKAADRGFRAVPHEDVLKFVRWDLDHNTLFEMDGWVLKQNITGVPIGGFLSAQLMCIWARVQEITFMQNQVPIFLRSPQKMGRRGMAQDDLNPRPASGLSRDGLGTQGCQFFQITWYGRLV